MTEYCRLCAEIKDPNEIVASISNDEQLIEQKLGACCQWTTENAEQRRYNIRFQRFQPLQPLQWLMMMMMMLKKREPFLSCITIIW